MAKLNIFSFGCKYNRRYHFNLIIDTRSLENPYYILELKSLSGLDNRVYNYVLSRPTTIKFLQDLIEYLDYFLNDNFKMYREIKIGIMCTGGQHRSVSVARFLYKYYRHIYETSVTHLDVYHEIS